MDHINSVYNSLYHYFNVLETTGYYRLNGINGLLIYSFIVSEIFNGPLGDYLDDNGLNTFNRALECLYRDGCLFSKPDRFRLSFPDPNYASGKLRITEAEDNRITDYGMSRTTEADTFKD